MTTKIESLRTAVATAQSKWTDLDWETGTEPTEEEREECEADAQEASDEGERAIEAAIRGDWAQVVAHAEEACRIERQYGDDPAWRPVLDLARELSAQSEADEISGAEAWRYLDGREVPIHTDAGRAQIWEAYCGSQSVREALCNGIADDWEGYAEDALRGLANYRNLPEDATLEAAEALAECLRKHAEDAIVKKIPGDKLVAYADAIVPESVDVYADGWCHAHYKYNPSEWYTPEEFDRAHGDRPIPITITLDAVADLSDRDEADDYAAAYEEAAEWLGSQCGLEITVLESRYCDDTERDTSTGIEEIVWQACHDLVVRGDDGMWTSSESESIANDVRRAAESL